MVATTSFGSGDGDWFLVGVVVIVVDFFLE